jgi:serine/threonine protein kinase/tetratricopeptide (TPR) repeat protein
MGRLHVVSDGTVGRASGDPAEEILGRILALPEPEQERALARACEDHPDLVTRLRDGYSFLKSAGMLDDIGGSLDHPERLGEFRLLSKLGGGGMGVVYLARQEPLDRTVAVKVMRPEQLFFPAARERFRREYEAIARLQHPGIVPIYTVGEAGGIPYFAMEHVEGRTLAEILADLKGFAADSLLATDFAQAIGAPATSPAFRGTYPEVCLRIAKQVAEALAHAHDRGILHRDVKPSNVILSADGSARLLDFGLTSSTGDERITKSGTQVGTLLYMSPEQLRGGRDALDARTDVYSLGVTLYELLTLQAPYVGPNSVTTQQMILEGRPHPIAARNRRVSPEAAAVCLKAMDSESGARYASAADFAADLENALAMRPVRAKPAGLLRRARRFVQRRPAATAAMVLAFLLVAGVPSALWMQATKHAHEVEKQRAKEREEHEFATQALSILEEMLRGASPYKRGRDAKIVDVLAAGEDRVRRNEKLAPSVRFRLLTTLGQMRFDIGDYDRANELLDEALPIAVQLKGESSQEHFRTLSMIADVRAGRGDVLSAIDLKRRAVATSTQLSGPASNQTSIEKHGLANLLLKSEQFKEAADLFHEVLERDRAANVPEADLAAVLANLASAETKLERFAEAEAHLSEALVIQNRLLPKDHPDLALANYTLATLLKQQGKLIEAGVVYAECREQISRAFGDDSEAMGIWSLSYGGFLELKLDRQGACTAYDEAARILSAAFGESHPGVRAAREKRAKLR